MYWLAKNDCVFCPTKVSSKGSRDLEHSGTYITFIMNKTVNKTEQKALQLGGKESSEMCTGTILANIRTYVLLTLYSISH